VRVKRPGVQVRARKGYWAFTTEDAKRALEPPKADPPKAVEAALSVVTTPSRSRLIRTWIGTERGAAGKTHVTLVWEPVPRPPGSSARAGDAPARMSVTAVAPDGSPYYRGKSPDAAPSATASATAPQGGSLSFDAAPGKVQLRLAVESASAEVLDTEMREIAVPDLTAADAVMATPGVFRARTVRELQQLKSDPKAVPTATREFTRAERVFIRVTTYDTGAAAQTVTARLLNRTGQSIADLPVSQPAATGDRNARDIELSLSTLAPGEYVVELTSTGPTAPLKELVGFRITS